MIEIHRRGFMMTAGTLVVPAAVTAPAAAAVLRRIDGGLSSSFPAHEPDLAREIVGKSHTDAAAVESLVKGRPALAKAAWDWGFGDWETALGAASHVGRRDIVEILTAHGARPDLFTFAMLDQVDVLRAICTANPGIQSLHGPHGITLMAHARNGEAASVQAYLEELGGADVPQVDLPLSAGAAAAYLGDYEPEAARDVVFHVKVNDRRGVLTFQRDEHSVRFLAHRGEHTFNPWGAAAVTIVFDVRDGQAAALTIHDGDLQVGAKRIGT